MKLKSYVILIIIALVILLIVGISSRVRSAKYGNDVHYCEKDEDCKCLAGSGCFNYEYEKCETQNCIDERDYTPDLCNQQGNESYSCISIVEGEECAEKGCQCINNQCMLFQIEKEQIDTKEEAIEYALKDDDFVNAAKNMSRNFRIKYDAYYYGSRKAWVVVVFAVDANDVEYDVVLKPSGEIIDKYYRSI